MSLRFWLCPILAPAIAVSTALGASISLEERLRTLKGSYPDAITAIDGNRLIFADGKILTIDDGLKKSHLEKLQNADIEDMLSQTYPLGTCVKGAPARNIDPGRLRSEGFFRQIYGGSRTAAQKNLASIDWFGRRLRFTTIGGADKALERVRDDLSKLGDEFAKYFRESAGTFNWRTIAGTARLSVHSFGAAIDLDPRYADYWRWSGAAAGDVPGYRNKLPLEIVGIFERQGFIWGGKWYHFDSMHFEYRPELIALGRLALARGCSR